MDQIDAAEGAGSPASTWGATPPQQISHYIASVAGILRFALLALAIEGVAIVVLAAVLVWQPQRTPGALYYTLSQEEQTLAREQVKLRLVFAEDLSESELRGLLMDLKGTIVSGP